MRMKSHAATARVFEPQHIVACCSISSMTAARESLVWRGAGNLSTKFENFHIGSCDARTFHQCD